MEGTTQNVSRGGLCATVMDPVAVGIDCDVSIVLVFDNDQQSEPLKVPARIVWVTDVDDGHQVGVMFRALTAQLNQYLGIFLKYLDGQKAEKRPKNVPLDDRFR